MSAADDDDDELAVLQECGTKGCFSTVDLEFDSDVNEYFCVYCRERFARAEEEGYHILLNDEENELVRTIFTAFDPNKTRAWDYEQFMQFIDKTSSYDVTASSPEELADLFKDEYDITLKDDKVIRLVDLQDMYGGFKFHGQDAIHSDATQLDEEGVVSLAQLE